MCDQSVEPGDHVLCPVCNKDFHYHCSGIRKAKWENLSKEEKQKQTCGNCKRPGTPGVPSNIEDLLLALKRDLVMEINASKNETNEKFRELQDSMNFINQQFEDNKKSVLKMGKDVSDAQREINDLKEENLQLKAQLAAVAVDVTELQQRSRVQNIEISGFPETPNENILTILGDVARHIGVEFDENQVNVAHRTPSATNNVKPIIVNFYSRELKREWVQHARKKRSIKSTDIRRGLPESRIYISEHMCPANKTLMGKAKAAMNALPRGTFKYVWFGDGKVFGRKNENSRSITIRSESDIIKFIGPIPPIPQQ